jgi:hypothetical protein
MSEDIQPEYADEPKLSVWEEKIGSPPGGWEPGSAPLVPTPAPH